jgi:hypothetical protein
MGLFHRFQKVGWLVRFGVSRNLDHRAPVIEGETGVTVLAILVTGLAVFLFFLALNAVDR